MFIGPLFPIKLHLLNTCTGTILLSALNLKSLGKTLYGSYHGCDKRNECNYLQHWLSFYTSALWQIVIIFDTLHTLLQQFISSYLP